MFKPIFVRAVALAAFSAGVWIAFTQQPPPQPLTVTKIAPDLHVIAGSGGNVAVYTTDEGAILVDDKFEPNYPQILEKVKEVTDKPVRYVLNTHQHGDHTGGNAKFLAAGAEIVVHENARNNMEKSSMPGVPRLTFSSQFSVKLGGKTVTMRHFGRGHTNGDAFLYFPALRVLHTGDMFIAGAPFIDHTNGGSGLEWPGTITRALGAFDFDTVIPGHGPIMKREDILKWKQSFETYNNQLRSLKREGKSESEALQIAKTDNVPGWGPNPGFGTRSFPGLWKEIQ
ncbi:MAG: MBL fold metallo-hydrolase [Bryobacteraceae bacterium]